MKMLNYNFLKTAAQKAANNGELVFKKDGGGSQTGGFYK